MRIQLQIDPKYVERGTTLLLNGKDSGRGDAIFSEELISKIRYMTEEQYASLRQLLSRGFSLEVLENGSIQIELPK